MTAENALADMCRRARLSGAYAAHLLPAVQTALELPEGRREAMLAVVERTLALRAEGLADEEAKYAHLDRLLLAAVARTLHAWTPDERLLATAASLARFDESGGGLDKAA